MTPSREELAQVVEDVAVGAVVEDVTAQLIAAAAELRKTCDGCQHLIRSARASATTHTCRVLNYCDVPADGSGFCHRHSPRLSPTQEEQR